MGAHIFRAPGRGAQNTAQPGTTAKALPELCPTRFHLETGRNSGLLYGSTPGILVLRTLGAC